MPKINQEEYEILKGLDDKWKWIARDSNQQLYAFDCPPNKSTPKGNWTNNWNAPYLLPHDWLQFIKWEDKEPYNIAELIEEYEEESEEIEVKDIEWLKKILFDESVIMLFPNDIEKLHELIEQLDESEVSLQVSPVIPKFVAEWIEKHRECESNVWHLMNNVKIQKDYNVELWTWLWSENNADVLARAWLDGYEMEREPKYIISINITDKDSKTNYETFLNKRGIFHSMENDSFNSEEFNWSEEEIRGLTKGDILFEHFAVKVEELEE